MNRNEIDAEPDPSGKAEKAWQILCGAFVASIPFMAGVNSALLIVLFLFWLFIPKKMEWKGNGLFILAAAMPFWVSVLGMGHTQNIDEGMFRLQQKALLVLMPLLFLTTQVNLIRLAQTWVSWFTLGTAAACFLSLGAGLYPWMKTGNAEYLTGHGLAQFLDLYPYVFALFCLISLIVLAEAERGSLRLYAWLDRRYRLGLGMLLLTVLLLLAVQQVIIIWVVLTLFYGWRVFPQRKWVVIMAVFLTVLLMSAVTLVPPLREKVMDIVSGSQRNTIPLDQEGPMQQEWNGIAVRKAIWTCAWDLIRENPVLGVGTGDGQDALQQSYTNRKFELAARYNRYNAHNQYVQLWVTTGAIGLAMWLISLAWLSLKFRSELPFLLGLIALLASMLTESMLETNKGNLVYGYVITLGIVLFRIRSHSAKPVIRA